MTYFNGLKFTAAQKELMIANFLRDWADTQEAIVKDQGMKSDWEDPKYASIRYAMYKGMQTTLVAMCEELDPENMYHNGKAKSRAEYDEEQRAMKAQFDIVAYMRGSDDDIEVACDIEGPEGYVTVLADEVACDIGDWQKDITDLDPENIDRDGEASWFDSWGDDKGLRDSEG